MAKKMQKQGVDRRYIYKEGEEVGVVMKLVERVKSLKSVRQELSRSHRMTLVVCLLPVTLAYDHGPR